MMFFSLVFVTSLILNHGVLSFQSINLKAILKPQKTSPFIELSPFEMSSSNFKVMKTFPDTPPDLCYDSCQETRGCERAIHCQTSSLCLPGMVCTARSRGTCYFTGTEGTKLESKTNCRISKPGLIKVVFADKGILQEQPALNNPRLAEGLDGSPSSQIPTEPEADTSNTGHTDSEIKAPDASSAALAIFASDDKTVQFETLNSGVSNVESQTDISDANIAVSKTDTSDANNIESKTDTSDVNNAESKMDISDNNNSESKTDILDANNIEPKMDISDNNNARSKTDTSDANDRKSESKLEISNASNVQSKTYTSDAYDIESEMDISDNNNAETKTDFLDASIRNSIIEKSDTNNGKSVIKTSDINNTEPDYNIPAGCLKEPTFKSQGAVRKRKTNKPGYPVVIEYECSRQGMWTYKFVTGTTEALCDEKGKWTLPALYCLPTNCYLTKTTGRDSKRAWYAGDVRQTKAGITCQKWNSNEPHSHAFSNKQQTVYPADGNVNEADNRCRDIHHDQAPWCYTTSNSTRWAFCDVPMCGDVSNCTSPPYQPGAYPVKTEIDGNLIHVAYKCLDGLTYLSGDTKATCDLATGIWKWPQLFCYSTVCYYYDGQLRQTAVYKGNVSKTINNRTCQRFDSQTPHNHTNSDEISDFPGETSLKDIGNKCRDGDGEGAPWCYTTDPKKRWEFCGVPECDIDLPNHRILP